MSNNCWTEVAYTKQWTSPYLAPIFLCMPVVALRSRRAAIRKGLMYYRLTFSVNVSAESFIEFNLLKGWVTVVFPVYCAERLERYSKHPSDVEPTPLITPAKEVDAHLLVW